jgi:hypothetical protein
MKRSRNLPPTSPRTTSRPSALELPLQRAFVLLDGRAQPPRHWARGAHHLAARAGDLRGERAAQPSRGDWKVKQQALEKWQSATSAIFKNRIQKFACP